MKAKIAIPSASKAVGVTQKVQSVKVEAGTKLQVNIVERGSFAKAAAAVDKHKSMSINVQSWSYVDNQYEATFAHNLNKFPAVNIVNTQEEVNYADIEYIDKNTVKIIVSATFSGKIYFN
jgi:hypothetical protein